MRLQAKYILFFVSMFISFFCKSVDKRNADCIIFDKYIKAMLPSRELPMGEVVTKTAQFFIGCPYEASTIETEPESLVVNLRKFDCTTFVESVLALSMTIKLYDNPTFENYCEQLEKIRYRNGVISNYTARLHYFTDWIYENGRRGYVEDLTKKVGGKELVLNLSFMSDNPDKYKSLTFHPEFVDIIRKKEREISARGKCYYIPENRIKEYDSNLKNGDIVCLVTNIKGLDVSHVGFLFYDGGKLSFIHASSAQKKVIVNQKSLREYLADSKRNIGIIVVRPLEHKR